MEMPGDVLQQQLAGVDVAQVLLVTLALRQLLQQVLVHVPGLVRSVIAEVQVDTWPVQASIVVKPQNISKLLWRRGDCSSEHSR